MYILTAQKSSQFSIDSAIAVVAKQQPVPGAYTKTCFFIADEYMDIEQYDSAQLWLNKIHALLPVKKVSLDNYFLLTRQAEVYYYNNLQQLGLQESRRSLAMAEALKDSILLADSYNFLGLFYMNIDSAEKSVGFYQKGLLYTKQPPNPQQYISLSKPHHLHGNLAEAYYKLAKYDSALFHNYFSLKESKAINWFRGIAVAYTGLGDVYIATHQNDSALASYTKGAIVAAQSGDIDVALVCYGGMARSHFELNNNASVDESLKLGFDLLQQHPNINRFYALLFLNSAIDIYHKRNEPNKLVKAMELKSSVEKANIDGNNRQLQTILNAGMENEKRILSMQITEAERKQELANTRLLMALAGIAVLAIIFFVYRYYQNQKLALSTIRQKISQDLHDDIGASLSSLQIYGTIAEQSVLTNPAKAVEMVQKISNQSKAIMENMNDIVWSMKTNDSNTSMEIRIKNYAAELLADSNINFKYSIMENADAVITGISARKNILLIIKEALNNIAKYSKAKSASLSFFIENKELVLIIKDDGSGFNTNAKAHGNGLENMDKRTKELKGVFTLQSALEKGTAIKAVFPLQYIT